MGSDEHGHHHHHHAHGAGRTDWGRAFALGVGLNVAFVVLEVIFGLAAGSLALLADAGHNLGDVLGLLLAWGASQLSQVQRSERRTYGLRRSSILAALFNALILLAAVGAIAWEAVLKFSQQTPVGGQMVIWVAAAGVVVNTVTALLFMAGRHDDLNIRGAFLHMAADAGVSAGVVLAGLLIVFTGWQWIDPAVSLLIVVVILGGTWGLLRDSINLALDAVPGQIDAEAVRQYLHELPAVVGVHDLHIWGMSTTETALTAHLVRSQERLDDALLTRAGQELRHRFGIAHVTLQVESGDPAHPCPLAAAGAV